MTQRPEKPADPNGDRDLAELMSLAGTRLKPPPEVEHSIRDEAVRHWERMVQARRTRQWRRRFAVAASVVLVSGLAWWGSGILLRGGPVLVANVDRVVGQAQVIPHDSDAQPEAARPHEPLWAGDALITDGSGRVAIDLTGGVVVRIDRHSHIELVSTSELVLVQGAVYVDTDSGITSDNPLTIETGHVTVRHVGTQYEVRTDGRSTQVRVRDGVVHVSNGTPQQVVERGEELVLREDGSSVRGEVSPTGPGWDWIMDVAARFDIEGESLDDFLTWAARESGYRLVFSNSQARAIAAKTILRGSIEGLAPLEAVAAVMEGTELMFNVEGEDLLIDLRAPRR